MPPAIRFSREAVLNAAYQLVRRDGPSALNARAVARELGGSTQPIFRLFSGMDELRNEVLKLAEAACRDKMLARMQDSCTPYLELGMAYLLFARDEPALFKLLFMRDRVSDGSCNDDDDEYRWVYEIIASSIHVKIETAALLYQRTWVYTHGLAVGIATKYIPCIAEKDMISMLQESFRAAANQLGVALSAS
ncbi:MAG: TetR/AcrR family transcriptional regulator [Clostridia bacterium]|nr:TetR/AcrR family transcriptional regulator [Clostridia bacterium]